MEDKICLVTGGTKGIGRATAVALAERGAQVIIVGRDEEAGNTAVGHTPNLTFLPADLAQQRDIHQLATQLHTQYPHLDLLINNAGLISQTRQLTPDGLEKTLAVNHLAPFLLTHLLRLLLQASPAPRIITVASQAHSDTLDFDNLQGEKSYDPLAQYKVSKLANILFTAELARRLTANPAQNHIIANCLHPGVIQTQLLSDYARASTPPNPLARVKRVLRTLRQMVQPAGDPATEGAARILYLATNPQAGQISGQYWHNDQPASPAPVAQDPILAQKLWAISAELTNVN